MVNGNTSGVQAAEKPEAGFFVRFWGVRGSISTSDPDTLRYGGNTSSLELRCGDRLLMLDGGTGMRYLGNRLCQSGAPVDADLFLTHTHYDHICGIPFFRPFFVPQNRFRIWAGHLLPRFTIGEVLKQLMKAPLFPVPPEIFQASVEFRDFSAGETLSLGPDVTVRTVALNHPDGATGYRIEYGGKSICYITDTEHMGGRPDERLIEFVRGADIMIFDCMYTDAEIGERSGWGHSTWQQGLALAEAGTVGTFVVFHHDPDHDDDFMDEIARDVAAARPGSVVAHEGLVLTP